MAALSNFLAGSLHQISPAFIDSIFTDVPVAERDALRRPDEEELISYATAIIDILRKERDREKRSRIQTRELADARIVALEAMVSRRDAELEACVASVDYQSPLKNSLPSTSSVKDIIVSHHEPMSQEEVISILDMTTARNKTLEMEINLLTKQVSGHSSTIKLLVFLFLISLRMLDFAVNRI